jgi:hypothetical protein
MMDRAAAWFHLLLSLSLGTIIYIMMFGAHWPGSFEPIETYGTVAAPLLSTFFLCVSQK